jgi:hypothetical protein
VKHYVGKLNIGVLFVLIQTLLYGAFLTLDFTNSNYDLSNKIKFSIIILCFCYALFLKEGAGRSIICYPSSRKPQCESDFLSRVCLQVALFFTVVSDLFILMLDYYFYGVLTFILVQQLYGIRLIMVQRNEAAERTNSVFFRSLCNRILIQAGIACAVSIILHQLGVVIESLLLATIFYFICILTNVMTAVSVAIHKPHGKGNVIFAIGMFLFLLCDINVGLFNLSGYITMPENLYHIIYSFSSILMWTFYAPAQVLIALSVRRS